MLAASDATGLSIKIDSPVTVTVGQPFTFTVAVTNKGTYGILETVAITCAAADTLSGIDTTCKDIVGPAYTYHSAANTFSATATDKAGNVGSGQTSFTVTVTVASLSTLVDPTLTSRCIPGVVTIDLAGLSVL